MVAFVRVNRDKRGYEHICLMRGAGQRGKGGAPRVLYVFRTPPGIRVGREPFDETVRRSLEEQNPGVHFDWPKLSVILPPPPDVEYWRERRRAEKAAKHTQRQEQHQDAARDTDSSTAAQGLEPDDDLTLDDEEISGEMARETVAGENEPAEVLAAPASLTPSESPASEARRRRRRRRGGRGRKRQPPSEGLAQVPADTPNIPDDSSKER